MTTQFFVRCSLGLALCLNVFGQGTKPPSPGGGTAPPTPTAPPRPGIPTTTQPNNTTTTPDMLQRPMYLSGKVTLDDGTPPPDPVVLQLVCRATPRSLGYTDSRGNFSFDLNNRNNSAMFVDASQNTGDFGGLNPTGMNSPGMSRNTMSRGNDPNERDLMGCDLQAALPGFRSDLLHLGARRSLDNPDVGTIILHRLANVEGLTISATSSLAPKDAKKALEKGRNAAKKAKWEEAQREFEKAVEIYPRYAAAWFDLGRVQEQLKDLEGARKSYAQALKADSKFVSPYLQLASMALHDQKWDDVASNTDHLLRLNPVDFPQAWLFNSVANYYLKNLDAAEKSAREGLSHDASHHLPKMNHLLGVILAQKQDYAGAVEQLRDYLRYAPNATDSEEVKKQLAEVEKFTGPEAKKQ